MFSNGLAIFFDRMLRTKAFISIIFLLLSSVYQSILRGLGDAKAPLRIILFSVVINALLDPLLIFGVGAMEAAVQGLPVVGYLAVLAALTLLALVFAPLVIAAGIRIHLE